LHSTEADWLIFIGSADGRRLSRKLLRKYGSNSGLALARAENAKSRIFKDLHIGKNRIPGSLVMTVGVSEQLRTVIVLAIWTGNTEK
jgi:hypothetical protein